MASKLMKIRPYLGMFRRTVTCSVLIGAPSLMAYVWLYQYLEFGPFSTPLQPDDLYPGLIILVGIFLFLGVLTAIMIVVVTAIFHGRISEPFRYLQLIGLVVLVPSTLCFILSLGHDVELYGGSFLIALARQPHIIGRWLLGTTVAVAICQYAANRFDAEVSPRKTDQSTPMWRAGPLIKLLILVTAVCALIPVAEYLIYLLRTSDGPVVLPENSRQLRQVFAQGLGTGLVLGNSMALTIMLCFNEILRPRTYRVAMFTVPLIAVILLKGWWLRQLPTRLQEGDASRLLTWGLSVVFMALTLYLCHIAAGRYLRAVTARKSNRLSK